MLEFIMHRNYYHRLLWEYFTCYGGVGHSWCWLEDQITQLLLAITICTNVTWEQWNQASLTRGKCSPCLKKLWSTFENLAFQKGVSYKTLSTSMTSKILSRYLVCAYLPSQKWIYFNFRENCAFWNSLLLREHVTTYLNICCGVVQFFHNVKFRAPINDL